MPQVTGGAGGQEEKRKRRAPGAPDRAADTSPGAPDTQDFYGGGTGLVTRTVTNLGLIEKASHGKLPPTLSYALSSINLDDKQMARAAKMAARQLDLQPSFLWNQNQISKMNDPLYGGPMRMSTLNRITEGFEPVILQAILSDQIIDSVNVGNKTSRTNLKDITKNRSAVTRKEVGNAIRATAKIADGMDLTAIEGMGLAIGIAKAKADPRVVANNLDIVARYDKAFSRDQAVGIAMAAAKYGVEFTKADDITAFLTPRAQVRSEEANHQIESLKRMYGDQWERFAPHTLVEERVDEQQTANQAVDLAMYERQGKNYMDTALGIEDQLRADEAAWNNSFLGKSLHLVMKKWNDYYTDIERGIIQVSTPIIGGLAELGVVDIKGKDIYGREYADTFQAALDWRDQRFKDFAEGKHLGQQFVEETGAPDWMATPIDLALGWYLDPGVILGKGLTIARAGRVAEGVLEKTTLARAVAQKIPGVKNGVNVSRDIADTGTYLRKVEQEAFGTKRNILGISPNGEYLWKVLKNPDAFTEELGKYITHFTASGGYTEDFMQGVAQRIRSGLADGSLTEERARRELGMAIVAQRTLHFTEGSIAAEIGQLKGAADAAATRATMRAVEDKGIIKFDLSESGILKTQADYADIADDVINKNTNPIGRPVQVIQEVPTRLRPIPGFGITRLGARTLAQSESRIARAAVAWTEFPAGNFLHIHQDPVNQLDRVMRDWGGGVYKASEIRAMRQEVALAAQSGTVEKSLIERLDDINREGAKRYIQSRGIPEELSDKIIQEANAQQIALNKKQLFGVLSEGQGYRGIDKPLLETQLVNQYFFVNPHDVKQLVNRYTSTIFNMKNVYHTIPGINKAIDEARNAAMALERAKQIAPRPDLSAAEAVAKREEQIRAAGDAAAKKAANKLFSKMDTPGIYKFFDDSADVLRTLTRFWKFGVVPRPGYIGRVILGDENLRFLATTGSMFERAAATHIDDATSALVRGFVTVPGVATVPKGAAGAVGTVAEKTAGNVLDRLYPNYIDEVIAPDGTKTVVSTVRPGREAYEALANTSWRESELMDNVIANSKLFERELKSEHFGRVVEADKQYYPLWEHNLKNQLGYSVPGKEALRSVIAGDNIATTTNKLKRWAWANTQIVRERLGVSKIDEWAEDLAKMTHAYTVGDVGIATMALNRSEGLQDVLRHLPSEVRRPDIHGPLLETLANGGSRLSIKSYIDYWYDVFIRQPENILNRQPYYAVWKRRAERSIAKLAPDLGPLREMKEVDGVLTEVLTDAGKYVDAASRDFALRQVKKIMFDFSENTRLGEAIGAVIPFLQPYLEQYAVWGHILVHRNPALAGYMHTIGRAGLESGFIRRDPTTNELMVPTSWWMEQSLLYNWVTGTKGVQTSTPISSLNLFFSSTADAPTQGVLGKFFGGAPIPLPGMSPWFANVAQRIFKGTKNQQLQSYLFNWGPSTPFIPGSWSKIIHAIEPDLYSDGLLESYQKKLATEYQDNGVMDQWKQELEEEGKSPQEVAKIIEERIVGKSRWMLALNGFMQMFNLGATKVDLNVQQKEKEFALLIQEYGDYIKASDEFYKRYPNNTLVPTGSTKPSAVMRDLNGNIIYDNNGKPITLGYRLPASELAQNLINADPEMRKTFNQYPELFGGLLLSLDPKLANKYDPTIGAQIIRDGLTRQVNLAEFIASGEQNGPNGFWEAVDSIETQFDQATAGKDEDSQDYQNAVDDKAKAYLHVYSQFPFYAPTRLQEFTTDSGVQGARFKYSGEDGPTNPRVVGKLRAFGQIEGLRDFDMTKAINTYFYGDGVVTGRDELKQEMARLGVGDITSASAEDAGLTAKYEKLKAAVEAQFPDGAYVLMDLLDNDLTQVGNAADKTVRQWKEAGDPRYAAFLDYDRQFQQIYNKKIDGQRDYQALRNLVNETMQTPRGRKLVQLSFEKRDYYQQEDYRQSLQTLSPELYSRFDFQLQGIKLNNKEANAFADLQTFKNAEFIRQDQAEAKNQVYEVRYDKINQMALDAVKKNPGLAPVIDAINTWGWGLRNADLDKQGGLLGKAWKRVFAAMDYSEHDAVYTYELHGYSRYVSTEDLTYWRWHQSWLKGVVNKWKKEVPAFRRQWEEMDNNYFTGSLYDLLMPDTFFPLGGKLDDKVIDGK